MKIIALLSGALCAISSGALAQSTVIIPAFQNRFGGIHQPVVALNTVNRSTTFQGQTFGGGSTFSTDPAARGVVTSPTAAAMQTRLDPTVMNVPVFPGNTAILMQQGQIVFSPYGIGAFPPNTGFFIQQGTGSSPVEVDPFATTATPGPAVNAVPGAAVNTVPYSAAPVPTTPQLVPSTIPVQQANPNPTIPVPNQAAPQQPNR